VNIQIKQITLRMSGVINNYKSHEIDSVISAYHQTNRRETM